MENLTAMHSYSEIILRNEKEWAFDSHSNMDER